jgi:hypothetical protein
MLKAKEFDSVKNKGCPFRLSINELLKEAKLTFALTILGKAIQLLFSWTSNAKSMAFN